MLLRAHVAAFAIQSWTKLIQRELVACNRIRRVAIETTASLPRLQAATHRFDKIVRRNLLVAGCGRKAVVARKVANQALVEMTVFLQYPRLRVLSKYPPDRQRQRVFSVRYRIRALAVFGLHGVKVLTHLNAEVRVRLQSRIRARTLHSVSHWCVRVGRCHPHMAGAASDRRSG